MVVNVVYNIEDKRWKPLPFRLNSKINEIFNNIVDVLKYKISKNKKIELSVTLTNDNNIKILNKEYRDIDKPTNVLSFPLYEKEFLKVLEIENYLPLGDIVLSFDTVERESVSVPFEEHLIHLIVHSILHLLGFNHVNDDDAKEMEKIEVDVLERMGIADPYN